MKMDLDEMEVSLGYLDDWKQLIQELRAAREVVSRLVDTVNDAKELDALGYDHFPIDGILSLEKVLLKYKEARRG